MTTAVTHRRVSPLVISVPTARRLRGISRGSLSPLLALAVALAGAIAQAEPAVLITDPAALAEVERNGGDLGSVVAGAPGATNDVLAARPTWRAITEVIRRDVEAVRRSDPASGVGIAGHAHRLFDVRWLSAKSARFELVGIANRMDRAAVHPGTCGETRLVYRLRYRTDKVGSRLPMTVLVTVGHGTDCAAVARAWPPRPPFQVTQVAVNLQLVRWPSAVRPDLGGHAEYVLRAFTPDGMPRRLENTPRPGQKAALLAWIKANAAAIDEGTALLPEALAADKAISVSPHGFARLANQPFRQQLAPADLVGLPAERLLRRLDEATCGGCHQSRSVAGFHLLGEDAPDEAAGNALAVAASPHLLGDLPRRRRWVEAILAGRSPERRQPFASRTRGSGASGEACSAEWPCDRGLICARGACQAASPDVGEPCEPLTFTASADPRRDRAKRGERLLCAAGRVCEATSVGFPGGMCAGACGDGTPNGTCGAIAILSDFNACLARKTPFPECLARHTRPALLRACSADLPCRDDYLCARTPGGAGACIPPYFLFQMRVDGHPSP